MDGHRHTVRDLRAREVKIRSLAQSEATWVTYLDAEPDTPEAVIGDILTTFMAWAAEQELQAVSRRTRAGLEKARADGKTLGPPSRVGRRPSGGDVQAAALRARGFRSIGQGLRGIAHHGAAQVDRILECDYEEGKIQCLVLQPQIILVDSEMLGHIDFQLSP